MSKVHQTKIGDHVVTTANIPPSEAIFVETKIASLLSKIASETDWKALSKASGLSLKGDVSEVLGNADNEQVIKAIFSSVSMLDPKVVGDLVIDLCSYSFVDGKNEGFDQTFQEPGLAMKVAFWVGRVNFEAFIKGFLSKSTEEEVKTSENTPLT